MIVTVNRTALTNTLKPLKEVIEKKTTIPILNQVRLEARDGRLYAEGTDLDVASRGSCSADIAQAGARCVEFATLEKLIALAGTEEIKLMAQGEQLHVVTGRRTHKLPSLAVEQYPEQLQVEGEPVELDGKKLATQITHVAFAITNEESRYALRGARLELHSNKVRLVATDGHRLSLVDYPIELPISEPKLDLIPAKALKALQKFGENAGKIQFSMVSNAMCAQTETTALRTRMLTGNFPNYDLVLPKRKQELIAIVDRMAWLNSLRAVIATADSKSYSARFEFAENTMKSLSQTQDVGATEDVIPVQYTGPEFVCGFNAQYLVDFLTLATADQVQLRFAANKPGEQQMEMREADDEKALWRYVVMPMRL